MSESAHRIMMNIFLLTPLREGRRHTPPDIDNNVSISTHAPAGGATITMYGDIYEQQPFLLTPLREGRPTWLLVLRNETNEHFYSRPCGRGDGRDGGGDSGCKRFLLTPLREGRQQFSTSPS